MLRTATLLRSGISSSRHVGLAGVGARWYVISMRLDYHSCEYELTLSLLMNF